MKKLLGILVLSLLVSNITFAKKNKNTWDYPLLEYSGWVIKGSENHYKFQSNLREDKDVLKEFKNNKNTGIISYLLFENDKIVIDVSDIPKKVSSGHTILDGLLPSHSMGKSLVSYVTGHAICEGYIDSVNVKLNDWPLIENTLYEDSILLDLLNMKAGDQKYIGERLKPRIDNMLKKDGLLVVIFPPFWGATNHHLDLVTRMPCIHWFFEYSTLLDAYISILDERGEEALWYKPDNRHPLPFEKGLTINGTGANEFHNLACRNWSIVVDGYKQGNVHGTFIKRNLAKGFKATQISLLREIFPIAYVLRKR